MENNNQSSKNKSKNKFNIFVLFLLLFALPAGSWYYLNAGFTYQKAAWSELKDYGSIPTFNLSTQEGLPFSDKNMKGNIVVSNFIDINKKDAVQKMELVKKLHDQFDDRQDMLFVFYDRSIKGTSAVDMKAFVEKHGITDHAQCIYLTGESASIQNLLQNGFKVPALDKERNVDQKYELSTALPADYPYFVLTDTTSMIRNYYNYKDHASMTRMIEHIAMILPRAPEKDIELRRDKEK